MSSKVEYLPLKKIIYRKDLLTSQRYKLHEFKDVFELKEWLNDEDKDFRHYD